MKGKRYKHYLYFDEENDEGSDFQTKVIKRNRCENKEDTPQKTKKKKVKLHKKQVKKKGKFFVVHTEADQPLCEIPAEQQNIPDFKIPEIRPTNENIENAQILNNSDFFKLKEEKQEALAQCIENFGSGFDPGKYQEEVNYEEDKFANRQKSFSFCTKDTKIPTELNMDLIGGNDQINNQNPTISPLPRDENNKPLISPINIQTLSPLIMPDNYMNMSSTPTLLNSFPNEFQKN